MKKYKIIIIIVVGLIINMICPFIDVVNADTRDFEKVTARGTMTIYDGQGDGLTDFQVYKIIDIYKHPWSGEIKYQFTSLFQSFLHHTSKHYYSVEEYMYLNSFPSNKTSSEVRDDHYTSYRSEFAILMSEFATWLRSYNDHGYSNDGQISPDSCGGYGSAYLEVGSYLVLPSRTNYVYGVMADTINYSSDGSITNSTIYAKVSKPSISLLANGLTSTSVGVGDKFFLKATASIPSYPATASSRRIFRLYITNEYGSSFMNEYNFASPTDLCVKIGGNNVCGSDVNSGQGVFTLHDGIVTVHNYDSYAHDPLYIEIDTKRINSNSLEVSIPLEKSSNSSNVIKSHLEYSEPYSEPYSENFIVSNEASVTIVGMSNSTPTELPFTGSYENILFIILGIIFITASITFFVIYRKRKLMN